MHDYRKYISWDSAITLIELLIVIVLPVLLILASSGMLASTQFFGGTDPRVALANFGPAAIASLGPLNMGNATLVDEVALRVRESSFGKEILSDPMFDSLVLAAEEFFIFDPI